MKGLIPWMRFSSPAWSTWAISPLAFWHSGYWSSSPIAAVSVASHSRSTAGWMKSAPARMRLLWRWSLPAFFCLALSWPLPSFAGSHDKHGLGFTGYDEAIQKAITRYWADFPDWRWWKAQLYQESAFDTNAVSGVGARGLCQAMPGTFADWSKQLGWGDANPHVAKYCIDGGAFYMSQLRRVKNWRDWPDPERHRMSMASYNAGAGWIMRARAACSALSWAATVACLPALTGPANAKQTTDYVRRIEKWKGMIP